MAMSEEALKAAVQAIADNIERVYKDCETIGNATGAIYDVLEKECFPTLTQVQQAWMGGTSDKYLQKANAKTNDIVQDCMDLREAAKSILAQYLEYSKQQIKALGVDPHAVLPDLF